MRRGLIITLTGLLLSGCTQGINPGDEIKRQNIGESKQQVSFSGCASYSSSAAAQKAWQKAGRPGWADPDGDGQVCRQQEKQSAAKQKDCKLQKAPRAVLLNRGKYPQTAFHIAVAIKMGQPDVLTIERSNTDQKRDAWAKVVGRQSNLKARQLDQDEWPMAFTSDQGGAGREANIALINSSDNRGAGSSIAGQLRGYCDGQRFRIKPYGKYPEPFSITVIANDGRRMNKTFKSE